MRWWFVHDHASHLLSKIMCLFNENVNFEGKYIMSKVIKLQWKKGKRERERGRTHTFMHSNSKQINLDSFCILIYGDWLLLIFFSFLFLYCRKKADLTMEGQFLIRQIYDDEITYNLIGAAVEILSEYSCLVMSCF